MPLAEIQFELSPLQAKSWQAFPQGQLRGHAFQEDNMLTAADWEQLFQVPNASEITTQLRTINGHFAAVWQGEDYAYAAVDIGRTMPLFWKVEEGKLILRDQLGPAHLDPTRWHAARALGQAEFIPGHHTLSFGWQQLQAGELLEFRNGMVYLHTYFEHRRPEPFTAGAEVLAADFLTCIDAITQRWIHYAAGRTIVIPLSGGYDSRLLLAALQRAGYPHLKTFTYGQAESQEAQLAKAITEQLGIEWEFVAYTPELLERFFQPEFEAYAHFAGNLSASPQEQDFFALQVLKDTGYLPADAIICPGYCGDFQAGSYALPDRIAKVNWQQKERLQAYLFERFNPQPSSELREFWQMHLPQADIQNTHEARSEMEHWLLREYVPKFVVNGVRAFEFWGYDWYLPLWDQAFITFWQRVPQLLREGMQLYRQVLAEQLFAPLGISYPEDFEQEQMSPIGHWLPLRWKKQLKAILPTQREHNINGLHWLNPAIQAHLGISPIDDRLTVNQLVGRWYHERLEATR